MIFKFNNVLQSFLKVKSVDTRRLCFKILSYSKTQCPKKDNNAIKIFCSITTQRIKSTVFWNFFFHSATVWSEWFLYKVAPTELKISPIMYFVIHNSVVLSKILKIVVPFWLLFVYVDYYQNNQFYRVKNQIFKILLLWHNNFQYFG